MRQIGTLRLFSSKFAADFPLLEIVRATSMDMDMGQDPSIGRSSTATSCVCIAKMKPSKKYVGHSFGACWTRY